MTVSYEKYIYSLMIGYIYIISLPSKIHFLIKNNNSDDEDDDKNNENNNNNCQVSVTRGTRRIGEEYVDSRDLHRAWGNGCHDYFFSKIVIKSSTNSND